MKNKNKKPKSKALTAAYKNSLNRRVGRKANDLHTETLDLRSLGAELPAKTMTIDGKEVEVFDYMTFVDVPLTQWWSSRHRKDFDCAVDEPLMSKDVFLRFVGPDNRDAASVFFEEHCAQLVCHAIQQRGGVVTRSIPKRLADVVLRISNQAAQNPMARAFFECLKANDNLMCRLTSN